VDYICDTAIILADEDYRIVAILAIAGLSAFAHKTCRDGEKTAPMRDGDYLSARWPGDAHRFASEFATMIG
jgi:hypothetical protein